MKKSNVTVVIPCYNDGIYLRQAVNSILGQTLLADEIIIVDDGSNDETKKIISGLSDEKITILTQVNQGLSKARNNGIAQAKTDYILPLDSDDFFEPTFIEKAVEILDQNQKIGVVGCYFRWFNEQSNNLRIIQTHGGNLKDFLFSNKGIANSLFRKICWEQVGGYDEKMIYGYEDWELWIRITGMGWEYYSIKEILFNYRRKSHSMYLTAKSNYDLEIKKYIFKKHKKFYAQYMEDTINFFFHLLENNENTKNKILNSKGYKFGKKILGFLRFFKRKR